MLPISVMAKNYYPKLWPKEYLVRLVQAGSLSVNTFEEVTGEKWRTEDESAEAAPDQQ